MSPKKITNIDQAELATLVSEEDEGKTVADLAAVEEMSEAESSYETKDIRPAKSYSWTYFTLALITALLLVDYIFQLLGAQFFWSEKFGYLISMTVRGVSILIVTYFFHRQVFSESRVMYIVTASVGFMSGIILSSYRFITDISLWTFLNLIVEPVDGVVIGLLASYIVHNLTRSSSSSPSLPSEGSVH